MGAETTDFSVHGRDVARDAAEPSVAGHLGAMLKDALSCKTAAGCAETVAMGAIAVAVGARFAGPLIKNALVDSAATAERAGLESTAARGASEATTNLSRSEALSADFRYFKETEGPGIKLYRAPDNGLSMNYQELADVQKYMGAGQWQGGHQPTLMNKMMKGWFHEQEDLLTPAQATKLMEQIGTVAKLDPR